MRANSNNRVSARGVVKNRCQVWSKRFHCMLYYLVVVDDLGLYCTLYPNPIPSIQGRTQKFSAREEHVNELYRSFEGESE